MDVGLNEAGESRCWHLLDSKDITIAFGRIGRSATIGTRPQADKWRVEIIYIGTGMQSL